MSLLVISPAREFFLMTTTESSRSMGIRCWDVEENWLGRKKHIGNISAPLLRVN